jgi:malonate transporter
MVEPHATGAVLPDSPSPERPPLSSVVILTLPFFGMIFLGDACAKLADIPEDGLAWMNVFVIYLALPALFFSLISHTPVSELTRGSFVVATTLSTLTVFLASFGIGMMASNRNIPQATIQGICGSYSNIGYMGPGLTLAVLGAGATIPTALVFCFDNALLFTILPLFMALGGAQKATPARLALGVVRRVLLHPFIMATLTGVVAAVTGLEPPRALGQMIDFLKNAAAPCALFTMGVTVALRPLKRIPAEIPLLLFMKLVAHPFLVWLLLGVIGDFEPIWIKTAILMAALPPALSVFVMARQADCYVERASSVVLIGTVASVVTLTAIIYLVTIDAVPMDPFPGLWS